MVDTTYRILWIRAAIMTPAPDPARSPPAFLSARVGGDYLASWAGVDPETARSTLPALAPFFGRFRFHYVLRSRWPAPFRQIREVAFYVIRGLRLSRARRYDAVVAYGLFSTGYAAYIVSRLTRTPLVLEVPGNPWRSFDAGRSHWLDPRPRLAPLLARFLLARADHIRLLYPSQVPEGLGDAPRSVFHNFVPVSALPRGEPEGRERTIVLIGSPLLLKGADLLITAFRRVEDEFPDWRLEIIGHAPDYAPFEDLAEGDPRVELLGPRPHAETLARLRRASLLVHPSRTEAMGRVLLEAMASGTPILASAVDGIPHYVDDGRTGLLFESENVADLESKLRLLLREPDRAWALADSAFRHVRESLSEHAYVREFCRMLDAATADHHPRGTGEAGE